MLLSTRRVWIEIQVLSLNLPDLAQLLSTRRVWIEIGLTILYESDVVCYSPHGEYGLKSGTGIGKEVMVSYSPHGEYGLKSQKSILFNEVKCYSPHGEYGLKFTQKNTSITHNTLLSTRRVWIEICGVCNRHYRAGVTLHTESMD